MKKYFKIFSSQGSLKRSFCLISGYLVLFVPLYAFRIDKINGEFLCNHLYACAVFFGGLYLGGKVTDFFTNKSETKKEIIETQFTGPVDAPKKG